MSAFKKNDPVPGFTFGMVNRSDGTDITSGTVSGYVKLDNGSQVALTNSPTYVGNGQWSVDLTAGEMNGDTVSLAFTHASAVTTSFPIKTVTKTTDDLQDLTAAQVNAECDTAISDAALATAASITALNDLSAAEVNAECDTAIADAALATSAALATVDANVDAILADTGTTIPAQISALNDLSVADILTTQMTESYAADGTAPTLAQALFLIQQAVGDFSISGTTLTVKQLDGTTTAATYTLDDASAPTSRTRAS